MSRTILRVNPHSKVCLNVAELLARSRPHFWSLSDSNEIRTHNHLVCKRTRNQLAKCLSVRLRTKWLWVRISLLLFYFLSLCPPTIRTIVDTLKKILVQYGLPKSFPQEIIYAYLRMWMSTWTQPSIKT